MVHTIGQNMGYGPTPDESESLRDSRANLILRCRLQPRMTVEVKNVGKIEVIFSTV
jgi:hypothetical protein